MSKKLVSRLVAATLAVAALGTVTAAHAAFIVCAVMYRDVNFSPNAPQFAVENQQAFGFLGWFNDQASSVRMFGGCSCTAFTDANFLGWPLNLTGDIANLGSSNPLFGWGDQFTSIFCQGPPR